MQNFVQMDRNVQAELGFLALDGVDITCTLILSNLVALGRMILRKKRDVVNMDLGGSPSNTGEVDPRIFRITIFRPTKFDSGSLNGLRMEIAGMKNYRAMHPPWDWDGFDPLETSPALLVLTSYSADQPCCNVSPGRIFGRQNFASHAVRDPSYILTTTILRTGLKFSKLLKKILGNHRKIFNRVLISNKQIMMQQ